MSKTRGSFKRIAANLWVVRPAKLVYVSKGIVYAFTGLVPTVIAFTALQLTLGLEG